MLLCIIAIHLEHQIYQRIFRYNVLIIAERKAKALYSNTIIIYSFVQRDDLEIVG